MTILIRRCTYCRGDEGALVYCARCVAPYHRDCWPATCYVPGCGSRALLVPDLPRAVAPAGCLGLFVELGEAVLGALAWLAGSGAPMSLKQQACSHGLSPHELELLKGRGGAARLVHAADCHARLTLCGLRVYGDGNRTVFFNSYTKALSLANDEVLCAACSAGWARARGVDVGNGRGHPADAGREPG